MPQFNRYYRKIQRGYGTSEDTKSGMNKELNNSHNYKLRQKPNRFAATRNSNKLRVFVRGTSFENGNSDKSDSRTITNSAPPLTVNMNQNCYLVSYGRIENCAFQKPVAYQASQDLNGNLNDKRKTYGTTSDCHSTQHFENVSLKPSTSVTALIQRNRARSIDTDNILTVKPGEDMNGNTRNSSDRRTGRRHSETSVYLGRDINITITLLHGTRVSGINEKSDRDLCNNTDGAYSDTDCRNANRVSDTDCSVTKPCRAESDCSRHRNQSTLTKPVSHTPYGNKRHCEVEKDNTKQGDVVCHNTGNNCSGASLSDSSEQSPQPVYPVKETHVNYDAQGAFSKENETRDITPCACDSSEGKGGIIKRVIPTDREEQETNPTRATSQLPTRHLSTRISQTTWPHPERSAGPDLKSITANRTPYESTDLVSRSTTNEDGSQKTTPTPGQSRPLLPPSGSEIFVKIILLGDYGVGKTHLIQALHRATKGDGGKGGFRCTEFRNKEYVELTTLIAGRTVRVKIVDTAGLERFRSMTSSYFRGAQGCFFVFNMTMADSFKSVMQWYLNMLEYADIQNTMLLGVTTLTQSRDARVVTSDQAFKLAEVIRTRYLEVSVAEEDLLLAGVSQMVNRVMKQLNALSDRAEAMITISPSEKKAVRKRQKTCCTS